MAPSRPSPSLLPSEPSTPPDHISSTPPPLPGYPPALNRMATVGNVPQMGSKLEAFDIVKTYYDLLSKDPDLTMPVAAIESLIEMLAQSQAMTIMETLDLVKAQSDYLKSRIPNSISLSAGTDLFQRYMISSLKPTTTGSFETVRQHLLANGRLFVARAKDARQKIAAFGSNFVADGSTILTHGGSRVVGALLLKTADLHPHRGYIRFKVIYVMSETRNAESRALVAALRSKGIPVATIEEGAVAYAMGKADVVMVGAEGVVENGGIISRMGTYQIAQLARSAGKTLYVTAESHKFVRLYPLGQFDLGVKQNVLEFKTENDDLTAEEKKFAARTPPPKDERKDYFTAARSDKRIFGPVTEAVDYTPPELIAAIVTETGVLTPSAVSEELISMWY